MGYPHFGVFFSPPSPGQTPPFACNFPPRPFFRFPPPHCYHKDSFPSHKYVAFFYFTRVAGYVSLDYSLSCPPSRCSGFDLPLLQLFHFELSCPPFSLHSFLLVLYVSATSRFWIGIETTCMTLFFDSEEFLSLEARLGQDLNCPQSIVFLSHVPPPPFC